MAAAGDRDDDADHLRQPVRGDPRLTTDAAMAHITAALDGVSEARLQALLGLPLMPWSLRGQARPPRPGLSARDLDRRWSATGCPTAAPTISSAG